MVDYEPDYTLYVSSSFFFFLYNFHLILCIRFRPGWHIQDHVRPIARSNPPSHNLTIPIILDAARLFIGIWMPLHEFPFASPIFRIYLPVCNPTIFSRT